MNCVVIVVIVITIQVSATCGLVACAYQRRKQIQKKKMSLILNGSNEYEEDTRKLFNDIDDLLYETDFHADVEKGESSLTA